ncbi:MAG TPA: protein kinase [Actinomycetota bacterium]|jgi:serine/threonine-protein kinase
MLTRDIALAGRYRIDREIGRGGMAHVYRATDTVLGRTVAVKVLNPDYASDPSFVERFRREARAAARLNHPNVVAVFDTGSDGDLHFIVMELVDGRSLAEVLGDEGPLDPERAAAIAEGIAEGLSFAHAGGLVHRDVKPANVMITPPGRVKVMDFGIARLATANTITHASTVFGTAAYLAPEQAQGRRVDARADVYALGVVLYEMLVGRVPFRADSALAVASKHVLEPPEAPSAVRTGIPAELEAVTLRALAKDPGDRYRGAGEMAAALRGAAVAGPPTAPLADDVATAVLPERTEAPPPVRRATHAAPRRRRRWAAPVVAVVIVAAVLAVLAAAVLNGPPRPKAPGTHTKHSGAPSHRASAAPPPSTPSTGAPGTSAPPATPPSSVDAAAAAVASTISTALDSRSIDDHVAADLGRSLDDAVHRYRQDGDLEHALHEIASAKDHLAKAVDHDDATPQAAVAIGAAFDRLAAAMQSGAPTSGPPGPPAPGGPPGPGPGPKPGHDHGPGPGKGDDQGGDGGD